MFWYPFNIADYKASTAHLSNEEDLAFRRLIDMYYDTELPIPLDSVWLARRIRVSVSSIESVLNDMFERQEDGYHHKRCDAEILKYQGFAESGKRGAAIRWGKGGDGGAIGTPSNPNANHNNNHNNKKQHTPIPAGFEIFWAAYPKRKSKGDAEKAFSKINPDDRLLSVILAAIDQAKTQEDWQKEKGKYIPYPASWLNAKGWQDEKTFVSVVKKVAI